VRHLTGVGKRRQPHSRNGRTAQRQFLEHGLNSSDDPPGWRSRMPPTEHSLAAFDLFQRGLPHSSRGEARGAAPSAVDAAQNVIGLYPWLTHHQHKAHNDPCQRNQPTNSVRTVLFRLPNGVHGLLLSHDPPAFFDPPKVRTTPTAGMSRRHPRS
jgi:hypothetical protein